MYLTASENSSATKEKRKHRIGISALLNTIARGGLEPFRIYLKHHVFSRLLFFCDEIHDKMYNCRLFSSWLSSTPVCYTFCGLGGRITLPPFIFLESVYLGFLPFDIARPVFRCSTIYVHEPIILDNTEDAKSLRVSCHLLRCVPLYYNVKSPSLQVV